MTRPVSVIPGHGAFVDRGALVELLPTLTWQAERLRSDGASPRVVALVEELQVAAKLLSRSGTGERSTEQRHAETTIPPRSGSPSSVRAGLTVVQAAQIAGIGERGMCARARRMQRCGEAWKVGREWRFDEAAVRRGRREVAR